MNKEQQITELLENLRGDVELQIGCLEQQGDVYWSPYEVGNWSSMLESIEKLSDLVKKS